MTKKEEKEKLDKKVSKTTNVSGIWPGMCAMQCIMLVLQYLFKLGMPWYAVWFPTLFSLSILAFVIVVMIIALIIVIAVD